MIDETKLIGALRKYADELSTVRGEIELANGVLKAITIVKAQPKVREWIPFTWRKADEEEKELYGLDFIYTCEIPDVEEEILVSDEKSVWKDTFMMDDDGFYLDGIGTGDLIGLAWQSLPKPYNE